MATKIFERFDQMAAVMGAEGDVSGHSPQHPEEGGGSLSTATLSITTLIILNFAMILWVGTSRHGLAMQVVYMEIGV